MKKIASFTVNHDTIKEGIYISRIDGDTVTYDVRIKRPNCGDYMSPAVAHTIEHLLATYIRNSEIEKSVIYVGPMGCMTGFYVILKENVSYGKAIEIIRNGFIFISEYSGKIIGAKKTECGNYRCHNLKGAKETARKFASEIKNWTTENVSYNN